MEHLFTKLRPKRSFYQKSIPLLRPRKLAHSLINISVEYMDKFEKKEMTGLFKINTTKDYCKGRKEPVIPKRHKEKIERQLEDNIITKVRNIFRILKGNKQIRDKIKRGIITLFEEEEDYYNQ